MITKQEREEFERDLKEGKFEHHTVDIQQVAKEIKSRAVAHEVAYDRAVDVVLSGVANTLNEREQTHGKFTNQALTSQSFKRWARNGKQWTNMDADMKESIEMILHKIARIVNGDPYHLDSWHDISGYATLVERRLGNEDEKPTS